MGNLKPKNVQKENNIFGFSIYIHYDCQLSKNLGRELDKQLYSDFCCVFSKFEGC